MTKPTQVKAPPISPTTRVPKILYNFELINPPERNMQGRIRVRKRDFETKKTESRLDRLLTLYISVTAMVISEFDAPNVSRSGIKKTVSDFRNPP